MLATDFAAASGSNRGSSSSGTSHSDDEEEEVELELSTTATGGIRDVASSEDVFKLYQQNFQKVSFIKCSNFYEEHY
jgi:hypothetical protein